MLLICGLPNAGKSTLSELFGDVVHFDGFLGRYEEGYELAKGRPECCVEGLFQRRKTRVELLEATGHPHNVCIWVDTPLEVCMSRPMFRGLRTMEPPTLDEGWDAIVVVPGALRGGENVLKMS